MKYQAFLLLPIIILGFFFSCVYGPDLICTMILPLPAKDLQRLEVKTVLVISSKATNGLPISCIPKIVGYFLEDP